MANAINFDQDFITDSELRLLTIKRVILDKLRVRFNEPDEIAPIPDQHTCNNAAHEIVDTLQCQGKIQAG